MDNPTPVKVKNRGTKAPPVQPKPEPIDNTELVEAFRKEGGQIVHIIPKRKSDRGMTLAFIPRSGHIELATAVQNRVDTFTKKIGTRTAIVHFNNGFTTNIPITRPSKKYGVAKSLRYALYGLCRDYERKGE